jgi:hypothetical protein
VLRIHVKKEMLLLIAIPSIIYFIMNFIEYKSYAYPLDEEYRLSKQFDLQNALYLNENQDAMQISPDYHNISKGSRKPSKDDKAMILVNFDYYFFPLQDISHYKPLKTDSRYKLILNKPYFLNFKAYQYEGFNVTARNNISSMDLHIKAFIGD